MQRNRLGLAGRSRLTAVLGPTNTGKTHLAMERMLGHASGMIGFPLRLLARENYDRAVKAKGEGLVALITGEERILPPGARYFLCTVESMPLARTVAFLGIDEIQMCADPDRGHIFTDRLLHARGSEETMFMGAETIRPLIRRLVPEAEFVTRPRFSALVHAGAAKLSRLPPRSAVVAFSIADVYALAELIRRQRGGTAIVLGALSPRTRNAQVAMYQAGEVDYLVATDAIGMGLNMQVDHVAFAAARKFDGRYPRPLTPAELAQIAGRAGRFTKNGSFGTTADIGAFDPETAERIEGHRFDPLEAVFWRSERLVFTSTEALRRSLAQTPSRSGLIRAREADDELALTHLAADREIVALARSPELVRLLWDVCQIPDFGKVESEAHGRLLTQIYRFLADGPQGRARLPSDWVARQVDRINRTDGDIEALMRRIAGIRTWTYVSHRPDWLDDASGWQERTRAIEDKLSDALHQRLIQRFVDRRTSSLVVRMRSRQELMTAVSATGEVLVEGHPVGLLEGFRFVADTTVADASSAPGDAKRVVQALAERALRAHMADRVARFEAEDADAFSLGDDAGLFWRGFLVARLVPGPEVLRPGIEPVATDLVGAALKERIRRRLAAWLAAHIEERLAPLFRARRAAVTGACRGLVFQVAEELGSLARERVAGQIAAIEDADRRTLSSLGFRIGRRSVWFQGTVRPDAVAMRAVLWCVQGGWQPVRPPQPGRVSLPVDGAAPPGFYEGCGYRIAGGRAIRVDMLERLLARAEKLADAGPFEPSPQLANLIGCGRDDLIAVLQALGFRADPIETGIVLRRAAPRAGRRGKRRGSTPTDPHSPFAPLRVLQPAR
ncbi:MAG: helicase-related protein [Rhodospirillales bacterium]